MSGACTHSAAVRVASIGDGLRIEPQFLNRELGHRGSHAEPMQNQSVNERKALRMRCQVYMLYVVLCFLTISNLVGIVYLEGELKPTGTCRYALTTQASGCADLDVAGLVGLIGGAISTLHLIRILYTFFTTPLLLHDGEKESKCHLENGGLNHQETQKKLAKAMGGAIVGLEIAITAIPLSPVFYFLTAVPAVIGAMSAAQRYFKM